MDDKAYHVFKGLKKDIKAIFYYPGVPFRAIITFVWKRLTISNPQTKYELELRVLKSTEITYRYVLMRNRLPNCENSV